jgi:hypothetical protein
MFHAQQQLSTPYMRDSKVLSLDVTVHIILPGHFFSTRAHWTNKLVGQLLIIVAVPTLFLDMTLMPV